MDKNYDQKAFEDKIYKKWEDSGAFTPPAGKDLPVGKQTFTVIMPPPNANDPLHVGHAMFVTVEDILIRFHRMLGEATLWLPGTDHAGIETQFVFEKKLAKIGKSRFDFDRETLYKMIWDYVAENSGVAIDQMKKLGASADWSRYKFTLNPEIVKLVQETFIELNKRGLVYKAEKLVNFCTKCGTSYSDLEVNHEERDDKLYTIDYGKGIKVATTRPETMLGDVAVAVNPEDPRYKNLVGINLELPLTNRTIPVIADEMVDITFGTGAVKITPTHDQNDWAVAERFKMNLQEICQKYKIVGENGKLTDSAGVYSGLSISTAREKIVEDLGDKVTEIKPYNHSVGVCYRCGRIIEPLPRSQFFIAVKSMADKTLMAMKNGDFEVLGSGHDKILKHWLENLRDWNVSRQIVWGIRMPVWYKKRTQEHENARIQDNDREFLVQIEKPEGNWVQETDTFDTWFSSGQWPFATLITSKEQDFERYFPTQVMETAYDILPFWVMRMLMLGIEMTGKVPFKTVYLHGLVRDEKGEKMSKSKGNVINPLQLSEQFGTDALRMALVMSTAAGVDSNTGENKVRGMRNFANKIWNAGRYIQELKNSRSQELKTDEVEEFKFKKEMNIFVKDITRQLIENKVGLASENAYNYFWHWFCDKQIELNKQGKVSNTALIGGFETFLKLLHPFVPFVTEAIWGELYPQEGLLISQHWP